jgi:hypothetical protein
LTTFIHVSSVRSCTTTIRKEGKLFYSHKKSAQLITE